MKHYHVYTVAFAFLLAFAVPFQANAQRSNFQNKTPAWWNALEQQLSNSLDQPIDQIRDETLQHIIFFAKNYPDHVDLSEIAPKLLDLYANDTNEARRTMAVIALQAIGNKGSMMRLAELVEDEPAGSLRNIALAVLADYFSS